MMMTTTMTMKVRTTGADNSKASASSTNPKEHWLSDRLWLKGTSVQLNFVVASRLTFQKLVKRWCNYDYCCTTNTIHLIVIQLQKLSVFFSNSVGIENIKRCLCHWYLTDFSVFAFFCREFLNLVRNSSKAGALIIRMSMKNCYHLPSKRNHFLNKI